jgi:hypothetical protein
MLCPVPLDVGDGEKVFARVTTCHNNKGQNVMTKRVCIVQRRCGPRCVPIGLHFIWTIDEEMEQNSLPERVLC